MSTAQPSSCWFEVCITKVGEASQQPISGSEFLVYLKDHFSLGGRGGGTDGRDGGQGDRGTGVSQGNQDKYWPSYQPSWSPPTRDLGAGQTPSDADQISLFN